MGKVLKLIALVAVGVIITIATGGAAAPFVSASNTLLGGAFTANAIVFGSALATGLSGLFIGAIGFVGTGGLSGAPSGVPEGAREQRLQKLLNPEEPRKILFGNTAAAADLRYWEVYGVDNMQYDEIVVVATHEIESIDVLNFDDEVGFATGVDTGSGDFSGKVTRVRVLEGSTFTAVGAGSIWTSTDTMTGLAYYALKWVYDPATFPQGFPQQYVAVCKGAMVYDPRKDTTEGGSGAHRHATQSTWRYTDGTDIGRNPVLQILWYLLGWRINGVLVAGMGVDPDDIDFASFITAANDAETESYECDIVLSTGDSHEANLGAIRATCGGELADTGGRYTIKVATDDTSNVAVALTTDDVVGPFEWTPKPKMRSQFNQVFGTFVDAGTLYKARPYPAVLNSAYEVADDWVRPTTIDYGGVTDDEQAQKLSRIFLNETRYQGEFTAPFNWNAFIANALDVVTLTFDPLGWTNKKFKVRTMALGTKGEIILTLREIDTAIYTPVTPTALGAAPTGTGFNPRQTIAVAGLNAVASVETGAGGALDDVVDVTWTTPSLGVKSTEVQFKLTAGSTWTSVFDADPTDSAAKIHGLIKNSGYDIRVRHITINNVAGAWATDTVTTGTSNNGVTLGQFFASNTYVFHNDDETFTVTGATKTLQTSSLLFESTGTTPLLTSPTTIIDGEYAALVRVRIKRLTGTGWAGDLQYSTSGHGFSTSHHATIADPTVIGTWVTLEWDMSNLDAGGTDWVDSVITGMEFLLGDTATDDFEINWILVGAIGGTGSNVAPASGAGASAGQGLITAGTGHVLHRNSIDSIIFRMHEDVVQDDGTNDRRTVNSLIPFTAEEGDAFTHAPTFPVIPEIVWGSGGLVIDGKATAHDRDTYIVRTVTGASSSGGTALHRLRTLASGLTAKSLNHDNPTTGLDRDSDAKAENDTTSTSTFGDLYTLGYTVTLTGFTGGPEPVPASVRVEYYEDSSGSPLIGGQRTHQGPENSTPTDVASTVTMTVNGIDLNDVFRILVVKTSAGTTTIALKTSPTVTTTYDIHNPSGLLDDDATPAGVNAIPGIVTHNKDAGQVN